MLLADAPQPRAGGVRDRPVDGAAEDLADLDRRLVEEARRSQLAGDRVGRPRRATARRGLVAGGTFTHGQQTRKH